MTDPSIAETLGLAVARAIADHSGACGRCFGKGRIHHNETCGRCEGSGVK